MSLLRRVRIALFVSLALLFSAGCAGTDSDQMISAPTNSQAASPSPSPSAVRLGTGGAVSSPTPEVAENTFEISFAENKASGDTGRLEVGLGETVSIRVTSMRADEVHLHGYDITVPVAAGRPAVLTFTATIPGGFALELENLGRDLATLQVS